MECKDRNCPIHGTLSTRGTQLEGKVVSDKMQGTAIVQRDRMIKVKKFDRYRRSRSRIPAHNPPCMAVKTGDIVRIMECRKLAKTVSFVIIGKVQAQNGEDAKEEAQEAKAQQKSETKVTPLKKAAPKKAKKVVKHG
jgi:small subunit ribosomal protein S17